MKFDQLKRIRKQLRNSLPKLNATNPKIFYNKREFIHTLYGAGLAGITVVNLEAKEKIRTPLDIPFEREDGFPTQRNPKFDAKKFKINSYSDCSDAQ